MNDNRMSILNLNEDCQLEIMKYIIADCELGDKSQGNLRNYADLIHFALAHEDFEAILVEYYRDLYNSLKFVFVAKRETLEIDFSELQSTHTGKGGIAFWRIYADAIRENNVLSKVILNYAPESFQPDFLDHFEIIKHALENKKSLKDVTIELNGYSLENLNNFGNITKLTLDVRMSAEALVTVCKSNPHLKSLKFTSTDILGRLSDIVPHCCNLKYLEFTPKPDIDAAEYAPLAELPNLEKMTIYKAYENGSLLNIFEAITKWQRPEFHPLKIIFSEALPHLTNVTIARINSLVRLKLQKHPKGIELRTSYNFWEISRDSSSLEQSLATITLIEASLDIRSDELTLYQCSTSDNDIRGFFVLLTTFNIKTFILDDNVKDILWVDTFFEKIEQFNLGESVELLSPLTNLETVTIKLVEYCFEMTNLKALFSFLNSCSASGVIEGPDWCIEFRKTERIKGLKIRSDILNSLFLEACICRDLITIEELDVSQCDDINIEDILKVAAVQPIKHLSISFTKAKDIENLSDLTELKKLTLCGSVKGSLIKLFDQLAKKDSTSLQCLEIYSTYISSEDLVRVSQIRSLKKLYLSCSQLEDSSSLMELAKSNIEDLSLEIPRVSLQNLFSAFATKSKLQHFKLNGRLNRKFLELTELKELSKIKSLKSLECICSCTNFSFCRNFKHLEELNITLSLQVTNEQEYLAKLENFESLTLSINHMRQYESTDNIECVCFLNIGDILANLKEVKKKALGYSYNNLYQAVASRSEKLTDLCTSITNVDDLYEITRIKSLRTLTLYVDEIDQINLEILGELSELKSLQIVLHCDHHEATIDNVLPILKCCRNLDRLLISTNHSKYIHYKIPRNIHALLKSVRNPTLQGPLTVILVDDDEPLYRVYNIPEILVSKRISLLGENAYLKIYDYKYE